MKNKIEEFKKCFIGINSYSVIIMRIGLYILLAVYFSAMCCAAFAGRGADYSECMFYFGELTQLGKECFGIFFVLPLLLEIIVRADKFDKR